MRFLKNKVRLIQDSLEGRDFESVSTQEFKPLDVVQLLSIQPETNKSESFHVSLLPMRRPRQKPTSPSAYSKNIVKNYGKALCSFACSRIALPYFEAFIDKKKLHSIRAPDFTEYIKSKKERLTNIESLRRLLIIDSEDSLEISDYKTLFKELSITFLKCFSVNWIFTGKLTHKLAHLQYRFKILRRVRDPEHFTYLKTLP